VGIAYPNRVAYPLKVNGEGFNSLVSD